MSDDKPVIVNVPIKAVGDSPGIKAGGKLRMKRRTIKVKGLLNDIPDVLEIDISALSIGMSIKIHQLQYETAKFLILQEQWSWQWPLPVCH
ncbi:MAG: hypothetical protein R2744_06305 [Bacteroidales bacterium]